MDGNAGRETQRRAMILDAVLGIVTVGGYSALSVSSITAVAGVPRSSFYRAFASPDAVLLAVHRMCADQLAERIAAAYDTHRPTGERLEACLAAMVDYLVADPVLADAFVVGAHSAGTSVLQVHEDALSTLTARVAAVLASEGMSSTDANRVARFGVGAIRDAVRTRIARGLVDELPRLVPELVSAAFPTLRPSVPARP